MTGHLIHIGFPKTGSHFLRRWFSLHPQLAYIEGGIGGYANAQEIAAQAVAPDPKIVFRVTCCEGYSAPVAMRGGFLMDHGDRNPELTVRAQTEACTALAALFPSAHILLITRGIRSIIFSGYSQYVRTGGTDDFMAYGEKWVAPEASPDASPLNYDRIVSLYSKQFDGRLIVLPYELLSDDPDRFGRELEARLGLNHFFMSRERLNASVSPVELAWYPALTEIVRRLPLRGRIRATVLPRYMHWALHNRLRPLIAMLQWLRPRAPITADLITDEWLEGCRDRADLLRNDPLYAPYARDYLF